MSEDTRLTDIEMKLMHLEEQIEDMNAVVLSQEKTIARLKLMLEDRQSDAEDTSVSANQRPPHY